MDDELPTGTQAVVVVEPEPVDGRHASATVPEAPPLRRRRRRSKVKRFVRRHRALVVIFTVVLVLLVALAGWLLWLNSQIGAITRFPYDPGSTPGVAGNAQNILLIGVDDPEAKEDLFAKLASGQWTPGEFRSDAIMVLHVDADRQSAEVISIPRDSFVDVPDHGRTKINAAFSYGGPSELAQVVSQVTGVRMDHAMVIDFTHFSDLTSALGGVDLYIPQTVTDPESGITWHHGPIHLQGHQALEYVRQRVGLPRGDFDRIQRQQNLLRALFDKTASAGTLANPIRVTNLVDQLRGFVAVDAGSTPGYLRSLAISSRHLRSSTTRFLTIPTTGTPTIDGASVVTIDETAVRTLFTAVAHDRFDDWFQQQTSVDQLPPEGQVK
jgi:LCP family protein required for cell wall assembly